jgi:hypothetical protein
MKTLILFFLAAFSIPMYAQSTGAPPPPPPCGQKGVPDNIPCYKDGKLINTNSPVTVPHTPLTPGGVPNIPAPGDNDSQPVTAPKITPPKITPPAPVPYKAPTIQPATQNTDDAPASAGDAPATPSSRATSGCHDFASCFLQRFNNSANARRAARSAEQNNARLIAANQAMVRQAAEKDFQYMEKIRLMITEDAAESKDLTGGRAEMARDLIEQEKSAWLTIKKSYCSGTPEANYIGLDGKEQPCKQE